MRCQGSDGARGKGGLTRGDCGRADVRWLRLWRWCRWKSPCSYKHVADTDSRDTDAAPLGPRPALLERLFQEAPLALPPPVLSGHAKGLRVHHWRFIHLGAVMCRCACLPAAEAALKLAPLGGARQALNYPASSLRPGTRPPLRPATASRIINVARGKRHPISTSHRSTQLLNTACNKH